MTRCNLKPVICETWWMCVASFVPEMSILCDLATRTVSRCNTTVVNTNPRRNAGANYKQNSLHHNVNELMYMLCVENLYFVCHRSYMMQKSSSKWSWILKKKTLFLCHLWRDRCWQIKTHFPSFGEHLWDGATLFLSVWLLNRWRLCLSPPFVQSGRESALMREQACGSPSAHWAGDCQSQPGLPGRKDGSRLLELRSLVMLEMGPTVARSVVTLTSCAVGKMWIIYAGLLLIGK